MEEDEDRAWSMKKPDGGEAPPSTSPAPPPLPSNVTGSPAPEEYIDSGGEVASPLCRLLLLFCVLYGEAPPGWPNPEEAARKRRLLERGSEGEKIIPPLPASRE